MAWFRRSSAPPAAPDFGEVDDFDVLVDEADWARVASNDDESESPEEFDADLPTRRLTPKPKEPEAEVQADELIIAEEVLLPDAGQQALVDEMLPIVLAYALEHQPAPTSFPTLARRALAKRAPELEDLFRIAAEDVAIGAAILRAANSPLFYRGNQIDGTRNAVSLLGQVSSGQIVTGVASRALFDLQTRAEYDLFPHAFNQLFHHAMTTAMTAAWLCERKRLPYGDRAFSGGLFANVGKLVALRALSALVLAGRVPHPMPEVVVARILDKVHVEVGAAFHKRWSLPDELWQICSMHHDAEVPVGTQFTTLHMVRVASGLDELRIDPVMNAGVAPETRQSIRALGLSKPDIVALSVRLGEIASYVTTTFG